MFALADKFSVALIKYYFLQPCLALLSTWMKQRVHKCFMKNAMLITALTWVEKPGHREGSIHLWNRPAAQLPGRAGLLPPTRLLWSRDCYPVGLQTVSCSLPSPFLKKMRLSRGMLVLGAGTCRCSGAGMWDHPEGMPGCLAPAAGGDDSPSESVPPPTKYSISAGSIFSMHLKCTFQQEPCRISAADPAAGFPGGLCPFPARKDVPGMESSRGACQWPHVPRARPSGCCKTGGIAAVAASC